MKKKKSEGKAMLLASLLERGRVELNEAMALLNVSESTARRMFDELEDERRAIRVHGGVQLLSGLTADYSYDATSRSAEAEKQAIARAAASYVRDGDVLYCDCGTTLAHFCRALAVRIAEEKLRVSIFTNSIANLEAFASLDTSSVRLTLTGGIYRPHRRDLCGLPAENTIAQMCFNRAYLGADGYDPGRAFMATDFETASLNRLAAQRADGVTILCDAGKLRRRSMVVSSPLEHVRALITDAGITSDEADILERADVRVITA